VKYTHLNKPVAVHVGHVNAQIVRDFQMFAQPLLEPAEIAAPDLRFN